MPQRAKRARMNFNGRYIRVKESEFEIIRDVLAPLSSGAPGAFSLTDDVALVDQGPIVVTKDMMIAGVHFLETDPLDIVARKLIRVNLSDLAAKGAKPIGYFLGCAWPKKTTLGEIERFAKGLEEDQRLYRCSLLGGDTTAHGAAKAPLTLSATFLGVPPRQGVLKRKGAIVGDDLYVSGTIGDAGLGLLALKDGAQFSRKDKKTLIERYHLPEPRLALGSAIAGLATAGLDVSDGLLADAGHLARMSDVRLLIEAARIPLSAAARDWCHRQSNLNRASARLAGLGDDYEILFSAPPSMRRSVEMAARASRTSVTRIGSVTRGDGVALISETGDEILVKRTGYDHFIR